MTIKPKYENLLKDKDVNRWFENLKAKSILTATVYLRTLGLYCELNKTNPKSILKLDKKDFRDLFSDFVRAMEKKEKAGSYIVRFKNALRSWLKFNYLDIKLNVNIKGENENPKIINERIPSKEELSRIIRKASSRGRVAIALMAFSGLRPESLGNFEGNDEIRLAILKN